jgi:hypothetical protein
MSQKNIDRDQESFLAKEGKREIIQNPDVGAGISDNRCNECANVKGIYDKKVDWEPGTGGSHL